MARLLRGVVFCTIAYVTAPLIHLWTVTPHRCGRQAGMGRALEWWMPARDIVAIGASAGGVEALAQVVAGFPATLKAAVFIVLHLPPDGISHLPRILSRAGPLPAAHAVDGDAIHPGRIYVAPPNHHLTVEGGSVRVTIGPRVNNVRPSIDVLFRSVARTFDQRAIGVVLSGTLDDGTLGLDAIQLRGGVTVIQDPQEAKFSGMPRSALERVRPDHVLSAREIGPLVGRLTEALPVSEPRPSVVPHAFAHLHSYRPYTEERSRRVDTSDLAPYPQDDPAPAPQQKRGNVASGLTCPTCHGSLWELEDEGLPRIECRVGHAFSVDAFLGEQAVALEDALWSAINALEERGSALRRFASRFAHTEQRQARYIEQAETVERQAGMLREGLVRVMQAEDRELPQASGA